MPSESEGNGVENPVLPKINGESETNDELEILESDDLPSEEETMGDHNHGNEVNQNERTNEENEVLKKKKQDERYLLESDGVLKKKRKKKRKEGQEKRRKRRRRKRKKYPSQETQNIPLEDFLQIVETMPYAFGREYHPQDQLFQTMNDGIKSVQEYLTESPLFKHDVNTPIKNDETKQDIDEQPTNLQTLRLLKALVKCWVNKRIHLKRMISCVKRYKFDYTHTSFLRDAKKFQHCYNMITNQLGDLIVGKEYQMMFSFYHWIIKYSKRLEESTDAQFVRLPEKKLHQESLSHVDYATRRMKEIRHIKLLKAPQMGINETKKSIHVHAPNAKVIRKTTPKYVAFNNTLKDTKACMIALKEIEIAYVSYLRVVLSFEATIRLTNGISPTKSKQRIQTLLNGLLDYFLFKRSTFVIDDVMGCLNHLFKLIDVHNELARRSEDGSVIEVSFFFSEMEWSTMCRLASQRADYFLNFDLLAHDILDAEGPARTVLKRQKTYCLFLHHLLLPKSTVFMRHQQQVFKKLLTFHSQLFSNEHFQPMTLLFPRHLTPVTAVSSYYSSSNDRSEQTAVHHVNKSIDLIYCFNSRLASTATASLFALGTFVLRYPSSVESLHKLSDIVPVTIPKKEYDHHCMFHATIYDALSRFVALLTTNTIDYAHYRRHFHLPLLNLHLAWLSLVKTHLPQIHASLSSMNSEKRKYKSILSMMTTTKEK
mmetsp:Transcript_816/g.1264  ORF Transcript_816/g.1264 Transcript_816/m.1264 type:complete len:711 (-) Transcript_816:2538-4670(-)